MEINELFTEANSMRTQGQTSVRKRRLLVLFVLVGGFFFFEIAMGYVTDSLALVADSFHMLGNEATLIVGYVAVKMSPKQWKKNTFGWARAEVLAALINTVFLIALCFSIAVKAFERFLGIQKIQRPEFLVICGCIGLIINIIASLLLQGNNMTTYVHHNVAYYFSKIARAGVKATPTVPHVIEQTPSKDVPVDQSKNIDEEAENNEGESRHNNSNFDGRRLSCVNRRLYPGYMHVRAMFAHSLTGSISSLLIITSGIIYLLSNWKYKHYLDPAFSLVIALLILCSVWTLLRDSALILLQTVPKHLKIEGIKQRLLQSIAEVLDVHELHVWQLAGNRIIATLHIRCGTLSEYMTVAGKVKEFFHNEGIHSTTVQPEFHDTDVTNQCVIVCPRQNELCLANACCGASRTANSEAQSRSS